MGHSYFYSYFHLLCWKLLANYPNIQRIALKPLENQKVLSLLLSIWLKLPKLTIIEYISLSHINKNLLRQTCISIWVIRSTYCFELMALWSGIYGCWSDRGSPLINEKWLISGTRIGAISSGDIWTLHAFGAFDHSAFPNMIVCPMSIVRRSGFMWLSRNSIHCRF